jgi:DNA repair protein RecO (recombination protein O)
MTVEKTSGIVIRLRPLTESSLIVSWLTADFGRLATVAKGARRPKSPFRGKLDLFYEAELSFRRSRRSELHTLSEMVLRQVHPQLRKDLAYVQQASYCAELLEMTTETDTPLLWAFDLLRGLVGHLPAQPPQMQTVFALEMRTLSELGLMPDLASARLSAGTRELARLLADAEWTLIARLRLSKEQEAELVQYLHGFLIYHLGRVPKTRAAALNAGAVPKSAAQLK